MANKTFNYKPIYAGFVWEATVEFRTTPALFPPGTRLLARVRSVVDGPVLATLTTENGALKILDEANLGFTINGRLTRGWTAGFVYLELIRTDLDPEQHLGIRLKVAVSRPI